MSITVTNLKTQIQARLSADLSGASLSDLLLLSVQATKFPDLDRSGLDTELSSRDAGYSGASSLSDLLVATQAANGGDPLGTVKEFPAGSNPPGYLEADGSTALMSAYPAATEFLRGGLLYEDGETSLTMFTVASSCPTTYPVPLLSKEGANVAILPIQAPGTYAGISAIPKTGAYVTVASVSNGGRCMRWSYGDYFYFINQARQINRVSAGTSSAMVVDGNYNHAVAFAPTGEVLAVGESGRVSTCSAHGSGPWANRGANFYSAINSAAMYHVEYDDVDGVFYVFTSVGNIYSIPPAQITSSAGATLVGTSGTGMGSHFQLKYARGETNRVFATIGVGGVVYYWNGANTFGSVTIPANIAGGTNSTRACDVAYSGGNFYITLEDGKVFTFAEADAGPNMFTNATLAQDLATNGLSSTLFRADTTTFGDGVILTDDGTNYTLYSMSTRSTPPGYFRLPIITHPTGGMAYFIKVI